MISVIIPAFNNAPYILESIASVRRQIQGNDDIEILVIDDGSSDNTREIVLNLQENDPVVKYFHQDHLFAAAARNRGLSESRGEWIYMLDADDISTGDGLETLLEATDRGDVNAVFALAQDFISPELSESQKAALCPRTEPYPGVLTGASLIRKSVFNKIGQFDSSLSSGETIEWLLRFRKEGFRTENLSFVALHRRLHLSNTGRLRKADEAANYARIIRKRMLEKK